MSKSENSCGDAKWQVLVDDVGVSMPRQVIAVAVIRAQASVGDDFVVVRDHNSPNDFVLDEDDTVDLRDGNVFYTLRRCDVQPRGECREPAKLAMFVDDRVEIVTRRDQTGKMVLQLFGVALNVQLIRDYERPNDEPIAKGDAALYDDGPVFVTRQREEGLKITVNSRVFTEDDGVKLEMTGGEIAALVYPEKPQETCVRLLSGGERLIDFAERISIALCATFNVIRKGVTGGYEQSRVGLEVGRLQEGGATVTVVEKPAAVVYHSLAVKPGLPIEKTDVLVLIPGGYPGQMIDGAYLPPGSPLLGRVKGSPQGDTVAALGQTWQLVSYHPHTNGIGPAWNPTKHGFHTYIGEVMSWLHDVA